MKCKNPICDVCNEGDEYSFYWHWYWLCNSVIAIGIGLILIFIVWWFIK